LFNYQGVLNRSIEDIDIPKQILYLSGFNRSCKDFSPGSASLLSSISVYLSCKDFSPGFLPLSSPTTGLQFYTNPARLSSTLPTLLSNYQGSLNRSIDVLDILKWILYFSGFNPIGVNLHPGSAFLFASAAAHKYYTSSTSGFNLSCKDFSPGLLPPSSPTTVHQSYTILTRLSPTLLILLAYMKATLQNFVHKFHVTRKNVLGLLASQELYYLESFYGQFQCLNDLLPY